MKGILVLLLKFRGLMFTPTRSKILLLLLLIVVIAAWSKLRLLEPGHHEPQRWRLDEYPGLINQDSQSVEQDSRSGN